MIFLPNCFRQNEQKFYSRLIARISKMRIYLRDDKMSEIKARQSEKRTILSKGFPGDDREVFDR